MEKIEYIGCFFDPQALQQFPMSKREGPLYRQISMPHVTFAYAPKEVPFSIFGAEVTVKVVGYGCDGVNEALQVELVEFPDALLPLITEIQVPHITLSVAKGGKPIGSRFLHFQPVESFLFYILFSS